MLFGLNEGITDLFLGLATKRRGIYPIEKICAKTLKYAYGIKIYDFYFTNNDGGFRNLFNTYFIDFATALDEYFTKMLYIKLNDLDERIIYALGTDIKALMTDTINELLKVTSDSGKDCKKYLLKELKSKDMKPIYDIIGEYNYEDYYDRYL